MSDEQQQSQEEKQKNLEHAQRMYDRAQLNVGIFKEKLAKARSKLESAREAYKKAVAEL